MDYATAVQRLLAMNNPQLTQRFNALQPGQGEAMYNQYMQQQANKPSPEQAYFDRMAPRMNNAMMRQPNPYAAQMGQPMDMSRRPQQATFVPGGNINSLWQRQR